MESGFTHGLITASVSYKMVTASANYIIEMDDKVNNLEDQKDFYTTIGTNFVF
jgi:hypothetical protein